ncbi:hypothetical protein [Clostridium sp.]|uniref:DUF7010 family protein n=1 Tax=Clostridium sp. TaxID=1506 RepID=UPI002FC5B518
MISKESRIMTLSGAQMEMRSSFLGGFAGQLVSGLIWLGAAAVSVLITPQYGMIFLFFGCMGIFPLTQLTLRMMGRPAKVNAENGLWGLGSQIAFTVPINFLLVGATILYRQMWFFPASMIVVGTHYLPFITLYGMKMYGVLSVLLILSGAGLALYGPQVFSLGGWLTGLILIIFAFIGRSIVLREEKSAK